MPAKKPPRRPKSTKITLTKRAEWQKILDEVDKDEIPVGVLESLRVNLIDGTVVEISIKDLMKDGMSSDDIQVRLNEKLEELNAYIVDVDFYIDVESVAKVVQSVTDNLLKRI